MTLSRARSTASAPTPDLSLEGDAEPEVAWRMEERRRRAGVDNGGASLVGEACLMGDRDGEGAKGEEGKMVLVVLHSRRGDEGARISPEVNWEV
jgi:hypothetical protein